ncbi:hypothetical protein IWW56_002315 [Coemansia sp. RSA 2131]|nr:hypothetical protein IWW56_002315 [Coemansia sp. RSA 2131]
MFHSLKRVPLQLRVSGMRRQSTVALNYTVNTPDHSTNDVPLVILHGLFGSKQNWRAISKQLSRTLQRPTYTVDLRNHGDSPHASPHTYEAMSADLVRFLGDHHMQKAVLVGHSMGGKVVMHTALDRPDLVAQLIVDDMVPTQVKLAHDFAQYVHTLQSIEQRELKSQKEADAVLQQVEKDVGVRQFLLTNMKKDSSGVYRSRIPLELLGNSLRGVMDWNVKGKRYEGPTLFIGGEKSPYVKPEAYGEMKACFPNYELEMLDTGHWVHAEMPREFMQLVEDFVNRHS